MLPVRDKDGGAVAIAAIAELTACIRGIDRAEEQVQQRRATDFSRVKMDLNRLIVAGAAARHLFVSGVLRRSPSITRDSLDHARHRFEIAFHTPEAAPCDGQHFGVCCLRLMAAHKARRQDEDGQGNLFDLMQCLHHSLRFLQPAVRLLIAQVRVIKCHAEVSASYHLEIGSNLASVPQKEGPMTEKMSTHQVEEDLRNEEILIYVNGRIVPKAEATVSVYDSGFMLGDGVWEGLRLYNGTWAFIDEHLNRLFEAAKAIDLDIGLTPEGVKQAVLDTQKANGMTTDAHARLMVTRGPKTRPFQHPSLSQQGPTMVIIMEHSRPNLPRPINLATVPHIRGLPMSQDPKLNSHSKLNCILACIAAEKAGADEGLMLDVNGFVNTTNACNFFIVRGGEVWTSTGDYCMNGITRQKVIDLCRANDIPVFERNYSLVDTYGADEAFLTGTFGAQTPVGMIDGRQIGTGEMGPMTKRIRALYKALIEKECA